MSFSEFNTVMIMCLIIILTGIVGLVTMSRPSKLLLAVFLILSLTTLLISLGSIAFAAIGVDDLRDPSLRFCEEGDKKGANIYY